MTRYNEGPSGLHKTYLEGFAIPHYEILRPVVIFGKLAVAIALIFGYKTQPAAVADGFMVGNFLFAQGELFVVELFGNPYGPVVVAATLVAAFGGGEQR